ncbi:glycosyltransferase family 33 protein [Hortaea werneckii]|uniref:Chitobiosyldiphosphodolichol beta-mannosyltransferase n=1 Tax=Hortaea werneckii TaxID=91943 RepID=A0A3M7EV00_HORWE|nr:glycosyltransferase family 33 protein [Hortaea werneckii]KAI7561464.1 glycosyltransferase family 33 protein [Hortaea werneckii]KAI7610515.1 glycosyltransferase family 33 protein [Hortaea werneckii]KAI7619228.1 glycosyltransferase family 33 protein [Hortaea werneckii]KAI7660805.1 glycosyltransferase family 33 protein [Hortaea werneckii]
MDAPWMIIWEMSLTIAVLISTGVTVFILTLPGAYSHHEPPEIAESTFTEDDKKDPKRSGYAHFQHNKSNDESLKFDTSVQVVVLGDIGRSPRMQYHALSIARHGGKVDLIGYVESDVHPDILTNRFINIIPIPAFPYQTKNKLFFLLLAPLKVAWQIQALYHALGYRTQAAKWMLVQNPPSIPTLLVAQILCFFRRTKLVIDWHNFGYSILALRLGDQHPLVRLSEWYEGFFARSASAHFAVTNAMCRFLREKWGIDALALHDRPAEHLQPLSNEQRIAFLKTRPELEGQTFDMQARSWRLIVSSTSWTPDEDFGVLLDALVQYASRRKQDPTLPKLWAVITGKGPQKGYYMQRIQKLVEERKLDDVIIATAWLSQEDYARLLGSADLGVSLHTSSSGVDLPMKVVDMFGTGLPVAGWSKFEAWPELVKEGENGRGFSSADGLTQVLQELFGGDEREIKKLRAGAMKECGRRWDDEWMPIAGRLFQLTG